MYSNKTGSYKHHNNTIIVVLIIINIGLFFLFGILFETPVSLIFIIIKTYIVKKVIFTVFAWFIKLLIYIFKIPEFLSRILEDFTFFSVTHFLKNSKLW